MNRITFPAMAKKTAKAPEPETPAPRLSGKTQDLLVLVTFAILWLTCAVVPSYPYIFPDGKEPRMAGPDAYFHLRHTEAVLKHYPVVERFDAMTNFPNGEVGLNQGFFDVAVATIVKVTSLKPVIVLAWISPLLILVIGVWGYFWLARGTNRDCAALFLLFLLLYPGPLGVLAALGQGDHHAAEVFLALAVAWSLDRLLQSSTSWTRAPLAALPLTAFYFSWAGAPLHLLLVGVVFYLAAWRPREQSESKSLALKGTLYGLTVMLVMAGVARFLPWAVIWDTSQRVFYLGTSLLTLGYPVLIAVTNRPWQRRWLPMLLFPLVPLAFALIFPPTRAEIMALTETRTQQVAEHVAISVPILNTFYGLTWILTLVALVKVWRKGAWWKAYVPLAYGGGLIFFWMQTRDFNYYPPPLVAACAAYAVEGLLGSTAWMVGGLVLLVLPPLIPGTGVQHPWMVREQFRETMIETDGLDEAAEWLKQTQGDLPADSPEAYGLVAPWDLGNMLAQAGHTPVGWSQTVSPELASLVYSDDPDLTYKRLREKKRPFRYILLPARNLAEKFLGEIMATDLKLEQMLVNSRVVKWKGLDMGLMDFSTRSQTTVLYQLYWNTAQGLGHYRLVFESSTNSLHAIELMPEKQQFQFTSFPLTDKSRKIFQPLLDQPKRPLETSRGDLVDAKIGPEVRIFEVVPGALLTGHAKPGSQVRATIVTRNPLTGEDHPVLYAATADSDGSFSIRVPYPTDKPMSPAPGTIEVKGPYRVEIDDKPLELQVPEADIQAEREIPVELPSPTRD